MRHLDLGLIAAAATFACAQASWAQAPPAAAKVAAAPRAQNAPAVGARPSPFLMLLRSAHLAPAQEKQVRQILVAHAAAARPLVARLRVVQARISDELLGSSSVTSADLAPLESQALQLRQNIGRNTIDAALAIRSVLTPDQLSRLAEVHNRLVSLRAQVENLLGPAGPRMLLAQPD